MAMRFSPGSLGEGVVAAVAFVTPEVDHVSYRGLTCKERDEPLEE